MRKDSREAAGRPGTPAVGGSAVRERDDGSQRSLVEDVNGTALDGPTGTTNGNAEDLAPAAPVTPLTEARSAVRPRPARLFNFLKWLYPGIGVKRWFFLVILGTLVVAAGVDVLMLPQWLTIGDWIGDFLYYQFGILYSQISPLNLTYVVIVGVPIVVLGVLLIIGGTHQVMRSITGSLNPENREPIVDIIRRRRQLAQGYRIVVIGGGTGLSTMLRGLKEYSSNITAVVTVTDDGGSSGRLTRDFQMPPPGDIRNCLVALADAEPLMQELFQYRFHQGGESLEGHSFGNLLIAAMMNITGDFEEAVRQTSRVLAIRGRVLPSTLRHVRIHAELLDGTIVEGEQAISSALQPIRRMGLSDPDAEPLDETLTAIATADAIIIGPGSVYTSIIPNFLVKNIADAVAASPAVKVYVCNVMTQPYETDGFAASDHVRAVVEQAGRRVFDYVLVNTSAPSEELLRRYESAHSHFVHPDVESIKALGFRPITGDFLSESAVVRHDPQKLSQAIVRLLTHRRVALGMYGR
jgi:uncharacterized cofD-like protein